MSGVFREMNEILSEKKPSANGILRDSRWKEIPPSTRNKN